MGILKIIEIQDVCVEESEMKCTDIADVRYAESLFGFCEVVVTFRFG